MKKFKSKIAFVLALSPFISAVSHASSTVEQEMSDFMAYHPEFAQQQKFSVLLRKDNAANTETFLSKNMQILPLTKVQPGIQAVECNDNESEVCVTVTKDKRIVKQSCECVAN